MLPEKPPVPTEELAQQLQELTAGADFGMLHGPRTFVTTSDELALSDGARDLMNDEEERLRNLIKEIQKKNIKALYQELKRIIFQERCATTELLLKLEATRSAVTWKELTPTVRELLRNLEGDASSRSKNLWNRIEFQHQVEEANRKLLTHEIPSGKEFSGAVEEIVSRGGPSCEHLTELLGIADAAFNLEELILALDTNRSQIPDTVYEELVKLIDQEAIFWEMDEIRELSMALKRITDRGIPEETMRQFEEIRKARSVRYLYAFYVRSKSLFINKTAAIEIRENLDLRGVRMNAVEAILMHATAHIAQDILEDRAAPGVAPRQLISLSTDLRRTFRSFSLPFAPSLLGKGMAPDLSAQSLRAVLSTPFMAAPPHSANQQAKEKPLSPSAPKQATQLPPLLRGGGIYQLPSDAVKMDIPRRRMPGF